MGERLSRSVRASGLLRVNCCYAFCSSSWVVCGINRCAVMHGCCAVLWWCAVAAGQMAQPGSVQSSGGGGYSGTAVILAATMSAAAVFLAAGVVALVLRYLHRRQQRGQAAAAVVSISHVSAPGFETVRSRCSFGPETTDEPSTSTE